VGRSLHGGGCTSFRGNCEGGVFVGGVGGLGSGVRGWGVCWVVAGLVGGGGGGDGCVWGWLWVDTNFGGGGRLCS